MSDGDKLAMAVESLQQASAPPPPPPPNRAAAPPGKPKAPDLANISNRVRQPRAKLSLTRKLGSLVDSVNEILSEIPNEKKSVLRQEESDGGNITVPTTAFVGLVMKKFVELPTPRWQMYPSVHALEKSAAGMQQTTGGIGSVTYQDKEKERKGIKRVNMDPIVRLQDFGAGEFEELMAKCRQKMQECCKDSLHEDHLGPEEVEKEKGSSDNGTFTGAFIVALLRCFRDITLGGSAARIPHAFTDQLAHSLPSRSESIRRRGSAACGFSACTTIASYCTACHSCPPPGARHWRFRSDFPNCCSSARPSIFCSGQYLCGCRPQRGAKASPSLCLPFTGLDGEDAVEIKQEN
jgi:hypothetical protein